LTLSAAGCYKSIAVFLSGGAVAQLGARLDGIEEVEGSNPFGSTIFTLEIPHAPSAAPSITGGNTDFILAGHFPGQSVPRVSVTNCK
jgi:hypothetical protein